MEFDIIVVLYVRLLNVVWNSWQVIWISEHSTTGSGGIIGSPGQRPLGQIGL